MKRFVSGLMMAALLVVLPTVSLAAEFRESKTGSVELSKSESAKNLYIAGANVNVSGSNEADLVAAGNILNLNGPVAGGILAAGSSINLTGSVDRNARMAGSDITVASAIKQDLLVAGATLTVSPEGSIGGDLLAVAGTITLNGPVDGNLKISAGTVTINSKIGGNVVIYGGDVILGDDADIAGNLTYHSEKEAVISSTAIISGATDFKKTEVQSFNAEGLAAAMGVFGFLGLLMSLAVLFVFVYVFPKSSYNLVKNSLDRVWSNLGWGFLVFAVAPMALIILAVTVLGVQLAGVALMFYVVALKVAYITATLAIGSQIVKWINKKDYRVDWLTVLVGTAAVVLLHLIPFVGSLIIWLVGLVVLGQLLRHTGEFIKSQR